MDNDPDRRNIRLSVKMACCTRDGQIAAALFADFEDILRARLPYAMILSRQYDSEKYDWDEQQVDRDDEELMTTDWLNGDSNNDGDAA